MRERTARFELRAQRTSWKYVATIVSCLALGLMPMAVPNVSEAADDIRAAEPASSPRRAEELLGELGRITRGQVRVDRSKRTGTVSFIGASPSAPLTQSTSADHKAAATHFVEQYGSLYGLTAPRDELRFSRQHPDTVGGTAARFSQQYAGLPVFGAEIAVQVGADGRVLSSLGNTIPTPVVDTTPTITDEQAVGIATGSLDPAKAWVVDAAPRLEIYEPALLGAPGPNGPRVVWRTEPRAPDAAELVLVDAHTGAVAWQLDQTAYGKDRRVCDNHNDPALSQEPCFSSTPARTEGQAPTAVAQVNSAYDLSGKFYDFFDTRFGRDSWDGYGTPLWSTVRYCPDASCLGTAFFIYGQAVFGDGFAGEDVVAHEFTHGFTQSTSGLIYFSQSGAINESISDLFGELVDQTDGLGNDAPSVRWRVAEGIPGGPWRNMADPTQFSHPDRMTSPMYYDLSGDNGGVHTNSGVGNKTAFLITDGGAFNGQSVAGLGIDKAAQLYHLVDLAFLGPTSVYADLGNALNQACTILIGTHGFTPSDCTNVAKAVTATELNTAPNGAGYHPVEPARILDTRFGIGHFGKVGPKETIDLPIAGPPDVPFFDPSAVVMNVTVTGGTAASHLTVFPAGVPMPVASNLNFAAGQTIPNLVTVQVGNGSTVRIFNNDGDVHVIADVVGYYDDYEGSAFTSVTPYRLLDSRDGTGGISTPWHGGTSRNLQVTGVPGSNVPLSGVTAVVLNVTAVGPSQESHLTVWPSGGPVPLASNLNFPPGRTIPNLVTVKVGTGGKVSIYNNEGDVDVVADVVGYYSAKPSGGRFTALTPTRLLDSRDGFGTAPSPWGPGEARTLQVTGQPSMGVPPVGVTAVVLNVTAVFPSDWSHLTVWNTGTVKPTASNLNFRPGDVIPNLVVAKVGTGGTISIFNNAGDVHVVADVVGYFN